MRSDRLGFSLIELLVATTVLGLLATIAYPMYSNYRARINRQQAITDIKTIENVIAQYRAAAHRNPQTLADIGRAGMQDPWGSPYVYTNLAPAASGGHGQSGGHHGNGGYGKLKARKDRNLVPINTDYDLYSKGKDGRSVAPLTAHPSRDDIVRGNNGAFVGLATDY